MRNMMAELLGNLGIRFDKLREAKKLILVVDDINKIEKLKNLEMQLMK